MDSDKDGDWETRNSGVEEEEDVVRIGRDRM